MTTSQTTKQAMQFSSFFGNFGVPQMKTIIIYDDNQS
jgi:3-mercaptopyruvate sulfurtransferase SseA